MAPTSKAGKKQAKRGNPNIKEIGKATQFKPDDPRINREGYRPSIRDMINKQILEIWAEEIPTERNKKITKLKAMLEGMMRSKNMAGPIYTIDSVAGKIPDVIKGEGENGEIVTKNIIEIIDHKNG